MRNFTREKIKRLTTNFRRVFELPRPHQLGNTVLVADKGLHAVAKGHVEVNSHAARRHGVRGLAVDERQVNRQPKHVGQRQAEISPRLGNGNQKADVALVKIKDQSILVEQTEGPFQGLAVLWSQLFKKEHRALAWLRCAVRAYSTTKKDLQTSFLKLHLLEEFTMAEKEKKEEKGGNEAGLTKRRS